MAKKKRVLLDNKTIEKLKIYFSEHIKSNTKTVK